MASTLRPCSIALVLLVSSSLRAQQAADLIITGARIYTVDEARPIADAMAIRDGHVMFVGSARGALALKGPSTRVLDETGRTIIPGMTDAHGHLEGMGETLREVDLVGTTSYDQVIARVAERAARAKPGEWIHGRGWDQNRWGDTRFPVHDALSRAVPNNPVVLTRIDGHAVLVNAKAMQLAGITARTADPAGGRIVRGADNAATGVFVDNAQRLIWKVVPPPSRAEERDALVAAMAEANKYGLTSVHDPGESREIIDIYHELGREGKLTLRAYVMIGDDSAALAYYFAQGPKSALYDAHLWVRSIKLYADGALGSRGAALLDPYSDDPGNRGLLVSTPEHLREVAVEALRHGFQVCTHAIGDRGNRVALDAYEAALREVPTADHRFRIEHAQVVDHADLPRFAQLDVIPSMQAVHATSDMYWAGKRLGPERILGAYAWRSLLETGVIIPNGSDFPVERVNPLYSFHAAISRQDEHDWPPGGWYPEQVMTREEALKSMTIWPAIAAFEEKELGSLTPGKRADFVILDQDIMRVAPSQVLATRVLATYVGGAPVYDAGSATPAERAATPRGHR